MARANINDIASLEALYSAEDFARDAAQNARAKAPVMHGITILSGPDQDGGFDLMTAARHSGEIDDAADGSVFLIPERSEISSGTGADSYGSPDGARAPGDYHADYRRFLELVIETARSTPFQEPIGKGEERLAGFHGG